MQYQIIGSDLQGLIASLAPGEEMRSDAGNMFFMSGGIKMETKATGGVLKGFKRALAGSSFFLSHFTNTSQGTENVGFASNVPGKIISIDMAKNPNGFICQRSAFLCSQSTVDIELKLEKRLGSGIFGGEGFFLQQLTGSGQAFLEAGGTNLEIQLQPGQELQVDTGSVVGFDPTVEYEIRFVKGAASLLFGGEGLFLMHMKGPGKVILQTLPFNKLAAGINAKSGRSESSKQVSTGATIATTAFNLLRK